MQNTLHSATVQKYVTGKTYHCFPCYVFVTFLKRPLPADESVVFCRAEKRVVNEIEGVVIILKTHV